MPSEQQKSTTPEDEKDRDPALRRWIPGYDGIYFATADGRVFSYYSRGHDKKAIEAEPIEMFGALDCDGYRKAILVRNGVRRYVRLHRVIAEAFHGPAPDGTVCAHLDGQKLNNRPSNLAYVTQRTNIHHKELHGTKRFGETHEKAKLTEADVISIRKDDRSCKILATIYGVSRGAIDGVKSGRNWKHLL